MISNTNVSDLNRYRMFIVGRANLVLAALKKWGNQQPAMQVKIELRGHLTTNTKFENVIVPSLTHSLLS